MHRYFEADSAQELWPELVTEFHNVNEVAISEGKGFVNGRGGQTVEILHAVLHLRDPRQRWAHSREPALNPAFALAEVLWILAGRQDSAFVNHWNPKLPEFAGNGPTYHGAYGWRLRNEHGVDQLQRAYEVLRATPENRQVVLEIWKPSLDLPSATGVASAADIPCNICSMIKVRDGKLHWTQVMRSNDFALGLPHNLVQWTTLQEILAGWLDLEVGSYTHLSDSLHVYSRDWHSIENGMSQISSYVSPIINRDVLSIPFDKFNEIFPIVEQKAQAMTHKTSNPRQLEALAHFPDCPVAYQNILFILAADTARRRGWTSEADALAEKCTNSALLSLWYRWHERMRS